MSNKISMGEKLLLGFVIIILGAAALMTYFAHSLLR